MTESDITSDKVELAHIIYDDHLDPKHQKRNVLVYASLISIIYFAAPVLYIGIQTGLCKHLHTTDTMANLPSTLFIAMAWFPVIIAWLFPQARLLKIIMSFSFGIMSLTGLWITILMLVQPSDKMIIGSIIVQAALLGSGTGLVGILNWEALRRGVSERIRGKALGLAFGLGPAFAVVGSLFAQLLLDGKLFELQPPQWLVFDNYRYNYAILFGTSAVCMALATFLVHFYRIPVPKIDAERENFNDAIIGGFKSLIRNRVLFIACLAYLLVYCGNMVQSNMNIFTLESVGREPKDLIGYQLALRFSFKILAGFLLGWLLIRTNPKVPLLVTVGLQMAAMLWLLLVPGYWFMIAFGFMGAGELFGVYYINYPVSCSPKSQVRRNIAFLSLISSLVGLSPMLYGWISDTWSLKASFWTALGIMLLATLLVIIKLPGRPKPFPEDWHTPDPAEDVYN